MLYDRQLKQEIVKYLDGREAIIILGSRQVGKTTLMKLIMEHLQPSGHVFYLDLEETRNLEIVEKGPENLSEYLLSLGAPPEGRSYVFLDEVHYMSNLSKFLKLSVDHFSHRFKLICTGSSALGIQIKFKDSLVGRKFVFSLYPLSFREFLIFKEKKQLADNLPVEPFEQGKDSTAFLREEYLRYFHEFLIFGGYPGVVLENNFEKKEKLLSEIVSSYIFKDIRGLFSIGDFGKFNDLVKMMARQTCSLVNVSELARTVGISRQTALNYLSILENSFLISFVAPYSRSAKVEVRKANKLYWLDNGLRNFLVGDLSPSVSRTDIGILLENMVFTGLLKSKKDIDDIFYWRTKDRTEVDFVCTRGGRLVPIEVKSQARPHRGIVSFMKRYGAQKGFIAHMGGFIGNDVSSIPGFWIA